VNTYYVGPISEPSWGVGQAELARRLVERWPELEPCASGELVTFVFPTGPPEVSVHPEGGCLTFRGWGEPSPEIVSWFRAQAPAQEEIVLADGSGALSQLLPPGITAEEIAHSFENGAWPS
jgi:hypothetical protein